MNKQERPVPPDDERLSGAELVIYGIILIGALLMMLVASISYYKYVVL